MIDEATNEESPGLFDDLLAMLATGGLVHLGVLRPHDQAEARIDLDAARHVIDLIQMLEEKTRGNRTPTEDRTLRETLSALQIRFVEVAESIEGAPPAPPPPPPPAPAAEPPAGKRDDDTPPRFHKTYG